MEVRYSAEGKTLFLTSQWPENDPSLEEIIAGGDQEINQIVLRRVEITKPIISHLLNLMNSRESLHSLEFENCPCGVGLELSRSEELIESFRKTSRLILRTGIQNTNDSSRYFLPVQGASRVSSLRICVRNLDESLTRELAAHVAKSQTLKDLSLSGSRRCGEHSSYLAEAFHANKSIERLDMCEFQRDPAHMEQLVTALIGHPNLRELGLSNNDLSENTLRALGELISNEECRLVGLDLSMQRNPLKISLLAPALASPSTGLKSIYLSDCGVTDDEAIAIIDALTLNEHLESLDLSKNRHLSEKFLLHLAERLPSLHIKNLDVIKLQPPNGSPAAMRALQEGLCENTQLELLKLLFWRELVPCRWIQVYINLNRGGRRALKENIPTALWPRVLERAQHRMYFCPLLKQTSVKEDAIFHLIRNAPGLWGFDR